ncbi:MAG: type II secretion system protein GspJ [Candidatus Omnitrophota bacterium]
MKIQQKQEKGFTLIELLISAAIFSVIVLSIYSAFRTGILSYNKVDSSFDLYQTARIAFNKIEHDLRNSFIYLQKDLQSKESSSFKADKYRLDFFSRLDSINSQAQTYPEICRVIYELDGNVLKRACYKGLDALEDISGLDIQADDLAGQVKEISFEYAFSVINNSEKCYDWQEVWPEQNIDEQEKSLPLAVRIKLVLSETNLKPNQQPKDLEFIKIVSLPLIDLNEK